MKKFIWIVLLGLLAAGCSTAPKTYSDPFAYCAAIGTVNTPDARYDGPAVPDVIINGYLQAAGLTDSTEPLDVLRQSTTWRCMDGQVMVCNYGANLPCDARANTDNTPTQAMNDYCAQNPGSDFIPMSVTGHESVYSWKCDGKNAVVDQQIDQPDAAGFLSRIWYALPAPAQN
jgi:hypothetical protein